MKTEVRSRKAEGRRQETGVRRDLRSLLRLALGCGLAAIVAGQTAYAQDAKLHIANLDKLANRAAEVVDVTLDQPMLKLAAKFMAADKDDEDTAQVQELIKNLKGIYVKSFEFDKEGEYSEADVDAIRAQLHAPTWQRIVGVRSKRQGENAEVYVMGAEDNVRGLTVIDAEPKELTVVNLVGPIDLDKLSDLEGHLGVPRMELDRPSRAPRAPKAAAESTAPAQRAPKPKAEGDSQ